MNMTLREPEAREQQDQSKISIRPHLFQVVQYPHDSLLQRLAYMLIRPPRFIYNPDILNTNKRSKRKYNIETYHLPFELTLYRPQDMRYVILYLHGNGSSRFQGTLFLNSLPSNIGLACFDFAGCGNRLESEFITLGLKESKEVDLAAVFLKKKGLRVVGWGRSMGAVSLLMSNQCDIMISDSAYSNLHTLCKQSSSKFLPSGCCCVFECLFPCVFGCINSKVEGLSGLNIKEMDVKQRLRKIGQEEQKRSICFVHGQEDSLIDYRHAEQLYGAFSGRKMLLVIEGSHNSNRNHQVIAKCLEFIEEGLTKAYKSLHFNNNLIEMNELNQGSIGNSKMSKETKDTKESRQNYKYSEESIKFSLKQLSIKASGRQTTNIEFTREHSLERPHSNKLSQSVVQSDYREKFFDQKGLMSRELEGFIYNEKLLLENGLMSKAKQQEIVNFCSVINEEDYQRMEGSEGGKGERGKRVLDKLLGGEGVGQVG